LDEMRSVTPPRYRSSLHSVGCTMNCWKKKQHCKM
ncbi:hypothetical protein T02_8726, partial [Trichinella nativa]